MLSLWLTEILFSENLEFGRHKFAKLREDQVLVNISRLTVLTMSSTMASVLTQQGLVVQH